MSESKRRRWVGDWLRSTLSSLPRWIQVVLGLGCVGLGGVLLVRPFTSLAVLVLLVGLGAILSGMARLAALHNVEQHVAAGRSLDYIGALFWVVGGCAVLVWRDISVQGVAVVVGLTLMASGGVDLVDSVRGDAGERLASLLKGVASAVLGVVALGWPDVTMLVVAVVFGVRMVMFGLSDLVGLVGRPKRQRPRPRVWRAALGLVLALALGAVSVQLHRAQPVVDAFYDAPAEVPTEPGTLLRAEPFARGVPDRATGWRILYTTTNHDGTPAVASAVVVAAKSETDQPRPVVAWAHGTTGVARRCAPSVLDDPFGSGAFYALDDVLDQDWVLVATDYIGLGTAGTHPYLVGSSAAHAVLDSVRAAHQLDSLELADQTVVWGHSQGGGAALWTGQLATGYSPDVNVIGVAALAPASDMVGLADNLTVLRGGSLFAAFVLVGYAGAYPDVAVDDYVRPAARTVVREMASRCLSEPAVLVSLLASVATDLSVFSADLRQGPLGDRLAENVPVGPFEMPLLVAQGDADTLITPPVQAAFVQRLCDDGMTVDYRTYAGRGHVEVVTADSPLLPDLVEWTKGRLAGEPAATSCPP